MTLCVAAAQCGALGEAARLAATAGALTPSSRAAWRYLAALSAGLGQETPIIRAMGRLSRLETDFDPAAMVADPAYPVATLRRTGLLDKLKHHL